MMMKLNKNRTKILAKYVWWVRPEKIKDLSSKKIITSVLVFGTYRDLHVLLPLFAKKDIQDAIANPLPGVWDKKSLNFWSLYFKQKAGKAKFRSI